jgi:adenylate kinase family enzyme
MKTLVFVLGATNAGKSTFLEAIKTEYPSTFLVQLGKYFRSKYPPEYFQGQAAPASTQKEAMRVLFEQIALAETENFDHILVDGQPRDIEQAMEIQARAKSMVPERDIFAIHLTAPKSVRESRAVARDTGSALALSLARMDNDVLCVYEVICAFQDFPIYTLNTALPFYDPGTAFRKICYATTRKRTDL